MKHKVVVSPQAETDIESAYLHIRGRAPETAKRWRHRLLKTILTLEYLPERHEIAPEAKDVGRDLRHAFFGVYRILYTVEVDEVRIQGLRHGARRPMRPDELPR